MAITFPAQSSSSGTPTKTEFEPHHETSFIVSREWQLATNLLTGSVNVRHVIFTRQFWRLTATFRTGSCGVHTFAEDNRSEVIDEK